MQSRCKLFRHFLILGSMVLLFTACGPMYRTDYTYTPPTDWRGRQCVNACLQDKTRCAISCRSQNQSCRFQSQAEGWLQYRAQARVNREMGFLPPNYYADSSQCDTDCGCGDCYTNCGGKVSGRTYCVANCGEQ